MKKFCIGLMLVSLQLFSLSLFASKTTSMGVVDRLAAEQTSTLFHPLSIATF
jgi:hypothetical protein